MRARRRGYALPVPEPEQTSIAFVGFMAAGKTSAARAVAKALDAELIDTDERIEAELGEPIGAFFERHGEAAFREIEERVVLESLSRGAVVALGGGAVESERIRAALSGHVTAWCRVRESTAWNRCRSSSRPLAASRGEFRRRFELRQPLYAEVGRVVLPRGGRETGVAVAPWLGVLRGAPQVRMLWARTASAEYPALFGPGTARLLDARGAPRLGRRRFAITDPLPVAATPELLPRVDVRLEATGGEGSKTLREAERLLGELADAGARRDDALVAVGGGVVGDLAGYCAAVYQRGIPVVQVPTTLVAQADSAFGGKTGVDLPQAKNYVGAFHQPAAVLVDPRALATLPPEELAAGFAEVLKTALIAGGGLWERVRALERFDAETIAPLVFDCAQTKLAVVASDERDGGGRAVLNLGHTVGHAIETASSYARYRHGEAVALGLLAALRLSGAEALRAQVAHLLELAGLPVALDPRIEAEAVLEAVGRDKKASAGGVGFVLLSEPGEPRYGQPVDPDSLRAAVEELQR